MNQRIKTYLSILLLGTLAYTTIGDRKIHTMCVPIGLMQQVPRIVATAQMVMQQAPRILMTASAYMMGFTTALWQPHNSSVTAVRPPLTKQVVPSQQDQVHIAPSIAMTISPQIEQVIKSQKISTTQVHNTQSTAVKTGTTTIAKPVTDEEIAAQVTQQIATQEEKKLVLHMTIRSGVTTFTIPGTETESIIRIDLPNGAQYSACEGRATLAVEFTNRLVHNEQRAGNWRFHESLCELRKAIWYNQEYRVVITKQLQYVISCLVQTQSPDLMMRIQACIAMQDLQSADPVFGNNLLVTVNALDHHFFHSDGTICRSALYDNAGACTPIIGLVDWIDEKIGDIIPRSQYISQQDYDRLKAHCSTNIFSCIYKWFTASTGRYCEMTSAQLSSAREFNAAMISCINHCARYEFKEAELLRDVYSSGLFNDIINYYKNEQMDQKQLKRQALYDEHGIIRIAHNDPLYKMCKLELEAANAAQKNVINQNILVRYHIKNIMHEKWNIPQSAPTCVHDALYTIIGLDCAALSDISLLQGCIEEIVAAAPPEQYKQLIDAFYLPSGILKEYAHHDIDVQAIKVPASIQDASSTALRQQLNTLMSLHVKNPQEASTINKAIACLEKTLNAKTEPERITCKNQFDLLYNQINGQSEKAKPAVNPQSDNPPTSGAPVPPNPPDPEEEEKQSNPLDKRQWTDEQIKADAVRKAQGRAINERGQAFEDLLQKQLGGKGGFSEGGRQFDGAVGNVWYEAKSGNFWNTILSSTKKLDDFKTAMGHRLSIAKSCGAKYKLFSNSPIPQAIKDWLTKKGIEFTEI
jgi:hypothetical protein